MFRDAQGVSHSIGAIVEIAAAFVLRWVGVSTLAAIVEVSGEFLAFAAEVGAGKTAAIAVPDVASDYASYLACY